jgi:small subunit ribosomal protein S20
VRSAVKTQIRKAERLIAGGELAGADAAVLQGIRALDRAAQKGVLHHNNAGRRKARLMQKYNAAKLATARN